MGSGLWLAGWNEPSGASRRKSAAVSRPRSRSCVPLVNLFSCDDPHLGLYGAFGYDLAFQFEPIELTLPRPHQQRDLVLYVPDDLLIVDHEGGIAQRFRYEFSVNGRSTAGLARGGARVPYEPDFDLEARCDHEPGGYAAGVRAAREYFARGDLFEVVTSQMFSEPSIESPAELFRRLKEQNPAPYGFLINLGRTGQSGEWLIGASPEMYVRVEGDRVETCPISGTIARGQDPIDDASQILALLNSAKDESELTMCTDVDRNDKSRNLRARLGQGDRAPPDRDVLAAHPHRGPCRRTPSAWGSMRWMRSCRTPGR